MRSQMIEALYQISLLTSPEPEVVFQRILEMVAEIYGNTMVMMNLLEGDCLRFRSIVNPHPAFQPGDTLSLSQTLCRIPLASSVPMLIQNAQEHPEFCHHLVVQLKLRRYLGVPIYNPTGTSVGTLCFLDDQTGTPMGEEDIRFLSLLAMRIGAELEREAQIQKRVLSLAEQAREQRKYRAEASRYKAFVDSTADAILSFSPVGQITSWNGGAERLFGYTAEEAIGASYTLLGTPEVYDFQHRVFEETMRGDMHRWYDTRRRHKSGAMIDVSITTSPLIIDGEVTGLVAVVRDITEKVRAAQELRESNIRLDALAREQHIIAQQLASLNSQLKANAEEKRNFVNMVIHDLRHPLTTMRTTLELLRFDRGKKQRLTDIKTLEERTRALGTLLDELVLYDQIEAGRSPLEIQPIDVATLISACVHEVGGDADTQTIPVRVAVAPDLGTVYLDERKLKHILLNLIANALKFTWEGHVTVRAYPENHNEWRLDVEDTGIGMTSVERERAFEEYFTGAQQDHGGVGLGLAITRRLCIALQARVTLRSSPGKGTIFQLIFPRHLHASETSSDTDEIGM